VHSANCGRRGYKPFDDPRLTFDESKACEMYFNGFSRAEIADELDVSRDYLRVLLQRARAKASVDIPLGAAGAPSDAAMPIERLLEFRDQLRANGVTRGINPRVALRFGLTANNVKVRLWRYDHSGGRRRAA